jgi:serine protease AprX
LGWSDWENLGGIWLSAPAASNGQVFAIGTDSALYRKVFDNSWTDTNWEYLGGTLSPLTPGAFGPGIWGIASSVEVYAIGTDTNLYHATASTSGLSNWESLGGNWTHGAAAIARECFTVDTNSRLYHRYYSRQSRDPGGPEVPGWDDWDDLGGTLVSSPAAVSWSAARHDVLALGLDGAIAQKSWTPDSGWGHWQSLGGVYIHGPALTSWGADRLDYFAVGADSAIYHRSWDGVGWSIPESMGGPPPYGLAVASPAAFSVNTVAEGGFYIELFAIGANSSMYHTRFSSS